MNSKSPFKWRHFQKEIILLNVRWYLRYPLSYRDLSEMMSERGLSVDHSTICRWVHTYSPEIDKRTRRFLKPTNDSWRVDETYIKVKGKWKYLYRAIDNDGNTLDFMLSARRNGQAAKRFFEKVLKNSHSMQPRVINTDKDQAYPSAVEDLQKEGTLDPNSKLRRVKYLNNKIEQDHRAVKKITNAGLGYKSFGTAWRTIRGIGIMHAINKGQVDGVDHRDSVAQKEFIEMLFDVAA